MAVSRRQLLASLAAMSATTAFGSAAGPLHAAVTRGSSSSTQPGRDARPVGLQLYTLRAELAQDFEGTIERVAKMGVVEVEFFNLFGRKAADVRRLLDDVGLVAPSTHTLMKPLKEDLPQLIDDCGALGHKYLVVAFLMPNERRTIDDYRGHVDVMQAASEKCKEAGVQLAYHNHDFEFVPIDGVVPYNVLLDETSADELVMELDLYWISKAGGDPIQTLSKSPARFPMVHVKDMDDTEKMDFIEVGDGTIDFAGIFSSDAASGIRHFYVEQDSIVGDHWESVERSLQGLRKAFGDR